MAEKGGTWKFKLQVDLPVHDSPASSFNQVDVAFRTFLMPGKPICVSNFEIFISNDGATLYEAQTSGSFRFEVHGFIQAHQIRDFALKHWLKHAEWSRIKSKLDKDHTYNTFLNDNTLKRDQVHGEPKVKPGGRPRKVNTLHYSKCTVNSAENGPKFAPQLAQGRLNLNIVISL
jgi:hypothetical protein